MDKEKEKEINNCEGQNAEPTAENPVEDNADQTPEGEVAAAETDPLEELQTKYDQLNDQHLRLMAEYDNFRKRSQREKDELYQNAASATIAKFLPVLDNLERAEQFEKDSEDFRKGFEMICKNFKESLESLGVEAFGEVGETFDANRHHAVMHIEDDSLGENVVAQVLQKGYKVGDKVVRYAMVQTAN